MKSEKIRAYIAQLRECASHTPSAHAFDWAVAQERCEVLDGVADSLEQMLMEEEEFEARKNKGLQSESNVKPTMGTLVTEGATPSSSTNALGDRDGI